MDADVREKNHLRRCYHNRKVGAPSMGAGTLQGLDVLHGWETLRTLKMALSDAVYNDKASLSTQVPFRPFYPQDLTRTLLRRHRGFGTTHSWPLAWVTTGWLIGSTQWLISPPCLRLGARVSEEAGAGMCLWEVGGRSECTQSRVAGFSEGGEFRTVPSWALLGDRLSVKGKDQEGLFFVTPGVFMAL